MRVLGEEKIKQPIGSSTPQSKAVQIRRTGKPKSKSAENLIQDACHRTEGGKVTIVDIAKDLPVIKFVKIGDHHWSILKETEREVWTVGRWAQVRLCGVLDKLFCIKFSTCSG